MKLISWVLSLIFAFSLGAGVRSDNNTETNSELQQKVQDHMDVIVDEAAAIVDDVTAEIRQNEHVQEAEAFAEDVKEIVNNTMDDINPTLAQRKRLLRQTPLRKRRRKPLKPQILHNLQKKNQQNSLLHNYLPRLLRATC